MPKGLRTTELGSTGMEITRVGFGAWAIGGGGWEWGWGAQDDDDSIAAIHHALELGVNWIDTAPRTVSATPRRWSGRAIAGARRAAATSSPRAAGPRGRADDARTASSATRIRRELEGSLARLGSTPIDLYQIHWPIPDEEIEEGWATLAELKEQGLVRHIGVSNFDVAQLRRAQPIAPVETLQPPYSLIAREVEEEMLPFAEREGIGVIVYSPMGSGLLTGAMTRRADRGPARGRLAQARPASFRNRSSPRTWRSSSGSRRSAERHGTTPGAVAVAWALRNPAVDGAIVGFRRPDQVEPIVAAAGLELSDEDVALIELQRKSSAF